ncbi:MAG TPA: VWA domain-containing protein, partial [Polyangiaceae bacterium]|nr:VWA domain-containing protein [Polyangiaceae bacterium]
MSLSSPITTLVRFGRELRRAGLGVSLGQLESCARAFEWVDPLSRSDVFHAAQATLLTRHEDRALFRQVFDAFWDGIEPAREQRLPLAPRHRPFERAPLAVLLAERAGVGDPELDVRDRSRTASDDESLARKDFSVLSPAELGALRRAIAERRWPFALRVTRRKRPSRRGPALDLRRVAARAARSGGALLELPRRVAKIKRRPIVILADVSGSMELYTRVLLAFFHALSKELVDVESFVFATRLTHITHELTLRHVDRALERVAQ